MDNSKQIDTSIGELQHLEHNLHHLLAQKQNIQVELQEISNALTEINNTDDEVYRILSGIMLKANKIELVKELEGREKILELRIKSVEKQEDILEKKSKELKEFVSKNIKKKQD